jgi:hypothetical protein
MPRNVRNIRRQSVAAPIEAPQTRSRDRVLSRKRGAVLAPVDTSVEHIGARESLVEKAYRNLKHGILANAYPPGFQATETEIAEREAMSRTP